MEKLIYCAGEKEKTDLIGLSNMLGTELGD